jgi:hypothetical protein
MVGVTAAPRARISLEKSAVLLHARGNKSWYSGAPRAPPLNASPSVSPAVDPPGSETIREELRHWESMSYFPPPFRGVPLPSGAARRASRGRARRLCAVCANGIARRDWEGIAGPQDFGCGLLRRAIPR